MKNILNVKVVGLLLFLVFAVLIFFSKTVYFYNIPTVTIAIPKNGDITKTEEAAGVAQWESTRTIYSKYSGKIETLLVKQGDAVKEGQLLATVSYDKEDALNKLDEIALNKKQLQVDIAGINNRISSLQNSIKEQETKEFKPDSISKIALSKAEDRVISLQNDLIRKKELFEAGVIPKNELDQISQDLESAKKDVEEAKQALADSEERNKKNQEDYNRTIKDSVQSYKDEIQNQMLLLQGKQISLQNYDLDASQINEDLKNFNENVNIVSTSNGIISDVSVNVGETIMANAPVATIGLEGSLLVSCEISKDNTFITTGDNCTLAGMSKKIAGKVTQVKTENGIRIAMVKLESTEATPGQMFTVTFEKNFKDQKVILPNGAINKDKDGYFIYQIEQRDGILGKEYFASVLRVATGESDDNNTAITKGITFFEPVIILSNKPFTNGDTVLIKNEADLIAK